MHLLSKLHPSIYTVLFTLNTELLKKLSSLRFLQTLKYVVKNQGDYTALW